MKEQNPEAVRFALRVRDVRPGSLIKNMNKKLAGLEAQWCIAVRSKSRQETAESENYQRDGGRERERGRTKRIREFINHPIVLGPCKMGQ